MKTQTYLAPKGYAMFIVILLLMTSTYAQKITVIKPGDNFNSKINQAKPGDEFHFKSGNYPQLNIRNVNGTESKPIVLKKKDNNGTVNFKGSYTTNSYWNGTQAGRIFNCSYIAFDKLTFSRGNEGVHVFESDHLIFKDCEIYDTGTVGIKFSKRTERNNSSKDYTHHIDWIGGKVHHTGNSRRGQYGEGFYIGQAGQNTDYTHDIWIENVEIYQIRGAEAIDVKPEVHNITVKNCHIHDIREMYARKTGNSTDDQVNGGAIQIIASRDNNDRTQRHHEFWIENNTIERVTAYSQNNEGPRGNGIAVIGQAGTYIKNNSIKNVQHYGIDGFANGGPRPGWKTLIDQKTVDQINSGSQKIAIRNGNYDVVNTIKNNPFSAQKWYKPNSTTNPPVTERFPNIESVSGEQNENPASAIIDSKLGDEDRWSAKGFPQTIIIDYGSSKRFDGAKLWTLNNRAYRYTISTSDSPNSNFRTFVDRSSNTSNNEPLVDDFESVSGRYVRLMIIGVHNDTTDWVSIRELQMQIATASPLVGSYFIENKNSKRRIKIGGTFNGADIVLGDTNSSDPAHQFEFIASEDQEGYYFIKNKETGYFLSPDGARSVLGTFVEASSQIGGDRALWKITAAQDGYYYLESKLSSNRPLRMRNNDCATFRGTKIETHDGDGDCTLWKLIATDINVKVNSNVLQENSITLYPNPSQDYIMVQSAKKELNFEILDLNGKVAKRGILTKNERKIPIRELPQGLYTLITSVNGNKMTNRFMVK